MTHDRPQILNILQIAEMLGKSPQTVIADRSRAPHRLPPACTPPGTRQPLWILEDVLAWLREHQEPPAAPAAALAAAQSPRRRGRPTKAEIARRAAAEKGGAQ